MNPLKYSSCIRMPTYIIPRPFHEQGAWVIQNTRRHKKLWIYRTNSPLSARSKVGNAYINQAVEKGDAHEYKKKVRT